MLTTQSLIAAAIAVLALTGCTESRDAGPRPTAVTNSPAPAGTDRAKAAGGQLQPLVPAAEDVPDGMELLAEESGPIGVDEISSFSSDPEGKEHELEEHPPQAAYAVQYVDSATGALLSVYVARYASPDDARAIYASEVAESEKEATKFAVAEVGDEAAGFRQPVPAGDVAELVTLRVRLGDLTWTVQTGGPDQADAGLARQIAETMVGRAA
jgi:hypothetical protein